MLETYLLRYDNAPHKVWADMASFPHHFHNKKEKRVIESDLPRSPPETQMKQFLDFIRKTLVSESQRKP